MKEHKQGKLKSGKRAFESKVSGKERKEEEAAVAALS
jgi:hypothetical protein